MFLYYYFKQIKKAKHLHTLIQLLLSNLPIILPLRNHTECHKQKFEKLHLTAIYGERELSGVRTLTKVTRTHRIKAIYVESQS